MSLNVYSNKEDIPTGMLYVDCNDDYFFGNTALRDDKFTREVIEIVDKATYLSEDTFLSRVKKWGALFKDNLSTGCKTLLNIQQHPDVCFNVAECGNNVLRLLPVINKGNVFWEIPVVILDEDCECDIVYKNKHFVSYVDFLNYVVEGDNIYEDV